MKSSVRSLLAMLMLLPPVLIAATCNGKKAAPKPAFEPTVFLHTSGDQKVRVSVEVARTPHERQQGLMHRSKLEPGTGMIFLFEEPSMQSFWMKNTLISLDMIFIDENLVVVGVVDNTVPMTLTPCRVDAPSQYVLEVKAGFAAHHGIGPGTKVTFKGFDYP
jgi:uncharacterized membrane protein (UPF0127 family)